MAQSLIKIELTKQTLKDLQNLKAANLTSNTVNVHDALEVLKKLGCMISHYRNDLLKIFPFDTPERRECFELLKAAYIDARYNKNYKISKNQLNYLIERVEKLKMVTERICLPEIEK